MILEEQRPDTAAITRAAEEFRRHNGTMRMSDAVRAGIHRRTLYAMRDSGRVEALARGLYRLTDAEPLSDRDLVTVAMKVPRGVVYLISALSFHEMTTQIPHDICIAVPRNDEPPRVAAPPVRAIRLSPKPYGAGIETHIIDGVPVKVYSREKTLADCFQHRYFVGMDVIIEAIECYRDQNRYDVDAIHRYAAICRVSKLARPYLEALLK